MRCREPGCPFDVTDGARPYGEGLVTMPSDGRCDYCRGTSRCENWRRCHNCAQLGNLCRVCAWFVAPGKIFHRNRWREVRAAVVAVMRDRSMRGVTWAREGELIVGRLGAFEIRLKVRGWAPTVQDVMTSYGVSETVAEKWLEPKTEAA